VIERRCSFFVVRTGKPSARSNRIWWPKTLSVPVPVRSDFSTPVVSTRSRRSRYCCTGRTLHRSAHGRMGVAHVTGAERRRL
jgi:hypothetical protein